NTYTGGTFINGGTLLLGSGTAIPTNSPVTVATGASFNIAAVSNTLATAIGTLSLNGGTFRVTAPSLSDYYLNQLAMTGGTVDMTGSADSWLHFTGAGITINAGTSTWTG